MTSPIIRQLMKESGKDREVVTRAWDRAKELTGEMYGASFEEFDEKEYSHAEQMARQLLGMQEQITVADFLKSDKSAKEFIEEMVQTSGNIGADIDSSVTHKTVPSDMSDSDSETREIEDDLEPDDSSAMDSEGIETTQDPDNPVGEADPLSIYEKKKSHDMKDGRGEITGIGRDSNGNKVVKIKTNAGTSFSIQTNGNVPAAHSASSMDDVDDKGWAKIEKEILAYVKAHGSAKQKELLPN